MAPDRLYYGVAEGRLKWSSWHPPICSQGLETRQLREQMLALQKENHILKRAVAIQHERHVAHEFRESEVNNLKQMLGQYQEQMRKLEVRIKATPCPLRICCYLLLCCL